MESKRQCLETLDRIEEALVSRIKKSDQFLPVRLNPIRRHGGSRTLSARINALRRWEASKLLEHYSKLCSEFFEIEEPETDGTFASELLLLERLDDEVPAANVAAKFKLHTKEFGRRRFVSDFTESSIREIDTYYPLTEQFGHKVDLEHWYHLLISDASVERKPATYREYLMNISKYGYHGQNELVTYLMDFYDRANAIGRTSGTTAREMILQLKVACPNAKSSELYCEPCQRYFANNNVFQSHLHGRKHQRALKSKSVPVPTERLPDSELLPKVLELVEPALKATVLDIDRKVGMSDQERKLEAEAIQQEREAEDTWRSDDDLADYNAPIREMSSHSKPLRDIEGKPIPRWLFKLQGLATQFNCEICGPSSKYAGRKNFERHFKEPTHLYGLSRLGFPFSPIFNGISSIQEATELQKQLKEQTPEKTKLQKEVEDEEGNVMSERMYEDLKKQGLI